MNGRRVLSSCQSSQPVWPGDYRRWFRQRRALCTSLQLGQSKEVAEQPRGDTAENPDRPWDDAGVYGRLFGDADPHPTGREIAEPKGNAGNERRKR